MTAHDGEKTKYEMPGYRRVVSCSKRFAEDSLLGRYVHKEGISAYRGELSSFGIAESVAKSLLFQRLTCFPTGFPLII